MKEFIVDYIADVIAISEINGYRRLIISLLFDEVTSADVIMYFKD